MHITVVLHIKLRDTSCCIPCVFKRTNTACKHNSADNDSITNNRIIKGILKFYSRLVCNVAKLFVIGEFDVNNYVYCCRRNFSSGPIFGGRPQKRFELSAPVSKRAHTRCCIFVRALISSTTLVRNLFLSSTSKFIYFDTTTLNNFTRNIRI